MTLLAYQPAWHGGLLWDDDGHITPDGLRSWRGLWRIWFEVGATQQYYPALHTVFWLLHRLWGDATLGYHLVNISLHALSAFLLAVILRRLQVPGAVVASLVFALHPVHVESVAWISEMKNTLSGAFYLGAALAYLRFDASRSRPAYVLAVALFSLALLSKTVTATLPAGLLVILWWQRGRLQWRTDVVPLAPFFFLGLFAGAITIWVERTFIGVQGEEFAFSAVERVLIAGRAVWFYLAKLLWPTGLVFIYPRWSIDPEISWQYLPPVGVGVLLVTLWLIRRRSPAPLAALLFFGLTLAPALGFVSVFPFRYSFVADHFQYLASIGVIVFVSAAAWRAIERTGPRAGLTGGLALFGVVAVLGALTREQSRQYADEGTLYRATIRANPSCWLAHNNLGVLLHRSGRLEEAAAEFRTAIEIEPRAFEAHQSLAVFLLDRDQPAEALALARAALEVRPDYPEAHNSAGAALQRLGRYQEAIASYQAALSLKPDYAEAVANLGTAFDAVGQLEAAVVEYERAASLQPRSALAQYRLGDGLRRAGRLQEAVVAYQRSIQLEPDLVEARSDLGLAFEALGRLDDAFLAFADVARLLPESARAQNNLGRVLMVAGRTVEAESRFLEALRLQGDFAAARRNYADLLARNGRFQDALVHYRLALESQPDSAETHCNMGVALAQLGRFQEAAAAFSEALRLRPGFELARVNLANLGALGRIARN